jgi:hypothetical protein
MGRKEHHLGEHAAELWCVREQGIEKRRTTVPDIPFPVGELKGSFEFLTASLGNRCKEILLAWEILVQGRFGDTKTLGDLIQSGTMVALVQEKAECGFDYLFPYPVLVFG